MTPETPHGLVRAIRAALDETERIAREAAETAQGETLQLDDLGCCLATDEAGVILSAEMGWTDPKPVALHIAHNDPAAVLRLVGAVREILAMHEPTPDGDCSTCLESESDIYGRTYEQSPCYHLRLLARGLGINPETEEQ